MMVKSAFVPLLLGLAGCMSTDASTTSAQEAQRFPGWITGCSAGPFGSDNCPAAQAATVMAQMPIGLLARDLPSASFETFALEEAVRRAGTAVQQKARSGGCDGVEQIQLTGEILRAKVSADPALPKDERDLFDHLINIVNNASDYVGKGC